MSQMTISARAGRAMGARARTRVIDAAPAGSSAFLLLCLLIVAVTFSAVLVLNTVRAEGSFVLGKLQVESTALHDQKVTLQEELAHKKSTESLAAEAKRLKMVPATSTATLRLSDGSITGVASTVQNGRTLTVDLPSTGIPLPKDDS